MNELESAVRRIVRDEVRKIFTSFGGALVDEEIPDLVKVRKKELKKSHARVKAKKAEASGDIIQKCSKCGVERRRLRRSGMCGNCDVVAKPAE